MLSKEDILAHLKTVEPEYRERFGVTKLGLFGSFANGSATASSDVDVLIEFESGTPALREKKSVIRQELGQQFGRPVDLCRERFIKPLVRDLIFKETVYV